MSRPKDFDYQRYLASREWGKRKAAVRDRSGGVCERCREEKAAAVHHLTYANIGEEPLEDLQHVCKPCHDYLSGGSDHDPTRYVLEEEDNDEPLSDVWYAVRKATELYRLTPSLYEGSCPKCRYPAPLIVQDLFSFWACTACNVSGDDVASWKRFLKK